MPSRNVPHLREVVRGAAQAHGLVLPLGVGVRGGLVLQYEAARWRL